MTLQVSQDAMVEIALMKAIEANPDKDKSEIITVVVEELQVPRATGSKTYSTQSQKATVGKVKWICEGSNIMEKTYKLSTILQFVEKYYENVMTSAMMTLIENRLDKAEMSNH